MKLTTLALLAMSIAALETPTACAISPGPAYSADAVQSSPKSAGNQRVGERAHARAGTSDPRADFERPPEPNLPAKPITLPLPKSPKAVLNTRQSWPGKRPTSIRQAQPVRAGGVPKARAARSQRSDKLRPAATPIAARSAPLLFQNGSHRVSNPALVGSAHWRNAGAGSIDGNQIKRKP